MLVAALGTRGALLLLAWLPVPLALWALREASPQRRLRPAWAGVLVLGLAGGSAVAAPPGFYRDLFEKRFGRVLWFSEGVAETVAVCEYKDGSRWIQFSDGRGASGTRSYQGGWLYAHLPLLLHPQPESAAVVCFGTGNTLGAASLHASCDARRHRAVARGRGGGAAASRRPITGSPAAAVRGSSSRMGATTCSRRAAATT